jgi:uracil-DNA glycosylase
MPDDRIQSVNAEGQVSGSSVESAIGTGLEKLLADVAACRICLERPSRTPLPHAPRPVLRVGRGTAGIWICGQAPGTRVHESGSPFTDPSGDRLRDWLGLTPDQFYDERHVAIVPMGFCFPGQDAKGGDLPPRPECARAWHDALFHLLNPPRLIVALGLHAQRYHLARLGMPDLAGRTLDETMSRWRTIYAQTGLLPLPHPSWRNSAWLKRHDWFATELLPVLRAEVRAIMAK